MKIFDKRPLASILCIMLMGFVTFSTGEVWLRVITIACAPLLLLFAFFKKCNSRFPIALCAALVISILSSYVYFDLWFFPEDKFIGVREIEGQVVGVDKSDDTAKIIFKTENVSGEPFSAYTLIMFIDAEEADEITTGSNIRLRGKIECFDDKGEFNSKNYYASLDINAKCILSDSIEVTSEGKPPISEKFANFRESLTRRAMLYSDNYSGKLISALLLGERDTLDSKLTLDFKRIGVTHMLALSGMHLAILSLWLTKLLAFFGIGKRTAGIFNIFFTAAYMILTGFPVSVVRAGIMLIILNLLFITVGSHDSVTSLSVAVFLICIFSPTSIFDISLWLSAFATLGILVYSEYLTQSVNRRKKPERDKRPLPLKILFGLLNWLKLSLLASVFAIASTILISASAFDGISVLSLISTAILSPLIELIMYLGTLTLILGGIIPIGKLLFPFTRAVGWIAGTLSSLDNIYVSSSSIITVVFSLITSILLVIFFVFLIKRKRMFIAIIAISLCATYSSSIIKSISIKNTEDIVYVNGDDRSTFVIKSSGAVGVLCSASYNTDATAEVSAAITNQKLSELDYYFATHYGFGLISHIDDLLSTFKIDALVLPHPRNEEEKTIYKRVANTCEQYGTDIYHFESKTPFYCGEVGITLNHSTLYGTGTIRTAFTLTRDGVIYTYLSSGMLMEDNINFSKRITKDTDVLILGSHGKSYGADFGNIDESFDNVSSFILCTEGLFFTQDAYEYYVEKGCKIYTHPDSISILLNK